MELITTRICMKKDIGVHNNLFGGILMAWLDETAAAYAQQLCGTPRVVTVKVEELVFKKPIKENDLVKIYGKVSKFGNTSITLAIEARRCDSFLLEEELVTHTSIVFVKIDENGNSALIDPALKARYYTNNPE
jgi:acyl-CoA thioesterase YciA